MNSIDVNGLLAQMRALSAQAGLPTAPVASSQQPAGVQEFATVLKQAVHGVEGSENQAANLSAAFERGAPNTDLSQVMLAVQKADLSFRAMNQVRNKLVEAYKNIMSMSV